MTKKKLKELIKSHRNVLFIDKNKNITMINLIGIEKVVGDYMYIYDKGYEIKNLYE